MVSGKKLMSLKLIEYVSKMGLRWLLLLLLLSRFSHVRLCATPSTAAHQPPPFLGFSRQEHWSGLPFARRSLIEDTKEESGITQQPKSTLSEWKHSHLRIASRPQECILFMRKSFNIHYKHCSITLNIVGFVPNHTQ